MRNMILVVLASLAMLLAVAASPALAAPMPVQSGPPVPYTHHSAKSFNMPAAACAKLKHDFPADATQPQFCVVHLDSESTDVYDIPKSGGLAVTTSLTTCSGTKTFYDTYYSYLFHVWNTSTFQWYGDNCQSLPSVTGQFCGVNYVIGALDGQDCHAGQWDASHEAAYFGITYSPYGLPVWNETAWTARVCDAYLSCYQTDDLGDIGP